MAFSLNRMVCGVTVRTRIVLLAALPLLGFLANGTAFTTGQAEVEDAFVSVKRASALAETSQDLKSMLGGMRIAARDFALNPSTELIQSFVDIHYSAEESLLRVETDARGGARQEIEGLRTRIAELKKRFDHMVVEQMTLGFSENDGIRHRMRLSATAVERIINEDMSWLSKTDAQALLVSLLVMRRYESDYRLTRTSIAQTEFMAEVVTFNQTLSRIVAAEIMKSDLSRQVKTYSDTFAEWIASTNTIRADVVSLDLDLRQIMPITDQIISSARQNAVAASAVLTASQARTRNIIILVGCAAVLIGLGFSWLIGRSITRPLNGLAGAMRRLAEGDTSAEIPATRASDEIGGMASSTAPPTMSRRRHATLRQASTPPRRTSPRRQARSRSWRRRSARSRARPPNRPRWRAARSRRRNAPRRP